MVTMPRESCDGKLGNPHACNTGCDVEVGRMAEPDLHIHGHQNAKVDRIDAETDRNRKQNQRGNQSARSRSTKEQDLDSLSIPHKFLRPHDLDTRSGQDQEASGDIRMDSIRSVGAETNQTNTNIARSFLQLTSLDNQVFERLGRYETNLWRQTAQILLLLSAIEFRAKDHLPDERPFFGKARRKNERYPPFDFNPFLRSAGRGLRYRR